MVRTNSHLDTDAARSDVLERQVADTVTAGQLTTELIIRLEARVSELERVTARMREHLHSQGVTVW